jgi:hypothetical protein
VTVERLLPTAEARELVRLAADVADKVLDPMVDERALVAGAARPAGLMAMQAGSAICIWCTKLPKYRVI